MPALPAPPVPPTPAPPAVVNTKFKLRGLQGSRQRQGAAYQMAEEGMGAQGWGTGEDQKSGPSKALDTVGGTPHPRPINGS